jgi:hypothetical protein
MWLDEVPIGVDVRPGAWKVNRATPEAVITHCNGPCPSLNIPSMKRRILSKCVPFQ